MNAYDIPPDVRQRPSPAQTTADGVVDFALPGQNFPVVTSGLPVFRLLDAPKLTIPAAARRLGVGETKMRAIVRKGAIPILRIGGKTVIIEQDLEGYLRGNYGTMSVPERKPSGRPALPKSIQESAMLNKAS